MPEIEYYFSVLSPFTYLAGDKLEQIAGRRNVAINYKPLDIIDLFGRTGGVPPKDRHPSRQAYRLQDLARIARLNRMAINLSPAHWPTNPQPGSCAIINAAGSGDGDIALLVRCLLRSCWAEELDIADAGVIRDCLVAAGFSPDMGEDDSGSAVAAYRANTEQAVGGNVFGAPSYVVGKEVFWGQDRLPHLDAWLAGEFT